MEPLTSKVLNIQIVSMRKEVRKAVVHQIHGFTQKANKLRLKKGSEEQKQKNSLKADNFVSEIQVLKKLKPDDVSLFALSNPSTTDLKQIISKPIISAEARAMAKLCLRENLQKVVNEFISKYNDSLELLNNLLSERCNKAEKQNKKKKKKKKKEAKSKPTKEDITNIEKKNVPSEPIDDLSDSSDSIPQLIPVEHSNDEMIVDISNDNEFSTEEFSDDDANPSGLTVSENTSDEQTESEDVNTTDVTIRPHKDTFSRKDNDSNLMKKGSTNDTKLEVNKNSKEVGNPSIKDSKALKPERKRVDPFFKTSNDSEYYTYCEVEDKLEEKTINSNRHSNFNESHAERNNKDSFKKGFRDNNSLKRGFPSRNSYQKNLNNKNSCRRDVYDKKPFKENLRASKPFNNSFNDKKQRYNASSNNNRENFRNADRSKKITGKFLGKPEQEVKLHPSWEAKKKLNQASVAFQGKKIVFDD